jgi:hypothetical protein
MYQPFDPLIPPPSSEPERETVKVDFAIFDAVVGEYEVQPGDFILLKVEGGRLLGSGDGQYWDEVMAVSEDLFFIDGKPYDFKFNRDSEGTVTGLMIYYEGLEIPAKKIR